MSLKCGLITENEALADQKCPPRHAIDVLEGSNRHTGGVPWYRGKHAGWIEAVLFLQKEGHKRIAAKLQRHFGLKDNGNIDLF